MSHHHSAAQKHLDHEDERNRLRALRALTGHEQKLRERTRLQVVRTLVQEPHAFRCPIPHRYDSALVVDHLDAPGAIGTDFDGCIV
jgi:hypothetical protein